MTENINVKNTPVADINPAEYNPRKMPAAQMRSLENSLREYGFVQPLIVNTETGNLVGGHQRLQAAKNLGIAEVPVVEITVTLQREKALNIALNKISGEWDFEVLVDLLDELEPTSDFELTGFQIDEFQAMERELNKTSKEGREGKTPPPPRVGISQPGEVYQLGRHTLVCGDSTDPETYKHTDTKARMMFTDPPYNIDYEGGTDEKLKILNDSFDTEDAYRDFLYAFLKAAHTKNAGVSYVCFSSNMSEPVFAAWRLADLHTSSEIHHVHDKPKRVKTKREKVTAPSTVLWDKDGFTLGRSHYQAGHEPILYGWHKSAGNKYWCGDRTQSNVWTYPKPHANREHPTMKPVELCERAIRNSSEPGDTVLDPFAGSGSTLVAAENIGRAAYAVEMDPRFIDVIIRRYLSLEGHGEVTRTVSVKGSAPDGWWKEPEEDEDAA